MAAKTLLAQAGQLAGARIQPGDIALLGERFGSLTTVGAGTITGALIASGILYRTGPTGAFIDTPDTATNILVALGQLNAAGGTSNIWGSGITDLDSGQTFRFRYINGVAFAMTFQTGVEGIIYGTAGGAGLGILGVAGNWRDYLVTIGNNTPRQSLQVTSVNANAAVTLTAPVPLGTITPGMWLSGTNVTSGTLILGVTHGQGVITGFTMNANATGSGTQAWVFSPTVRFDNLGSGVL